MARSLTVLDKRRSRSVLIVAAFPLHFWMLERVRNDKGLTFLDFSSIRAVRERRQKKLYARALRLAERVAEGETLTFRPTGNSMVPLIHSRDEVVVSPVDPTRVEVGDIVLTKVAGNVCIHHVKAVEPAKRQVQIGNDRGGINGWTGFDRVYGIAVSVAGAERAGAKDKVVQRDT
jgi:hypothetical protein